MSIELSNQKIDALPPLKDVINDHGLAAKKSLGQNFILDLNLTRRIARTVQHLSEGTAIEIGPGPGGLTRAILLEGAPHLIAIEKDSRCIAALQPLIRASDGRLTLLEADALDVDIETLGTAPRHVVANLPYNISTKLLTNWLHKISSWSSLTLMFQKEVADRLKAVPHTKDYGRLSILTQHLCNIRREFIIGPGAFTPPPKIDSAVITLTPRTGRPEINLQTLERLTAQAFNERRKMLRSNLKTMIPDLEQTFEQLGLKPTARAEDLSVDDFVKLTQFLDSLKSA